MPVPFHKPFLVGTEMPCLQEAVIAGRWQKESEACLSFFASYFPGSRCFLTNSCSTALDMALRLLCLQPEDEIIIPAFGYVAVANAVVLNGARPVYADVTAADGNICPQSITAAITAKTKAIIGIHYAGRPFDVEALLTICRQHNLWLIEDAAQSMGTAIQNKNLGSFGHIACLSFDYLKNISCGQGGLLIVNDPQLAEIAQIANDSGTDKQKMLEGRQEQFDWVGIGYNIHINPLGSFFLQQQLQALPHITANRLASWNRYHQQLLPLHEAGKIFLPEAGIPHNGHIFYLLTDSLQQRKELRAFLRSHQVFAEHHYSPLAESPFGKSFARPQPALTNTTLYCQHLLRLPLWNNMPEEDIDQVCSLIKSFYA